MDYGRPVQFGVFVTPDATQPQRALDTAMLADELGFDLIGVQGHPYQRRFFDTYVIAALVLDFGMDSFLISEDPAAMRKFCFRGRAEGPRTS